MPVVQSSSYPGRPWYFPNGHIETIIPSMFFKVEGVNYQRERLELSDGDFLDLDWLKHDSRKLIVLSHGLEGSSDRHYMKRPAKFFSGQGWDILAWNCRSCSGEMNRLPRFYHHGETQDLRSVIQHAISKGYEQIVLIGFSMGGSFTLKYLGEEGSTLGNQVKAAVVFSVPCHVQDSAAQLKRGLSKMYQTRFLRKLKAKIQQKQRSFPELKRDWNQIRDFIDFHMHYTLPMYGFKSVQDFFDQARSDVHIPQITVPVLMVSAENDPMLGEPNYPVAIVAKSKNVWMEVPKTGGHVGFTLANNPYSYMEIRAMGFLREHRL
jgi:uncharacterized protein